MKKLIFFLTLSFISSQIMANEYLEEPYDQGQDQNYEQHQADPKPVLDRSPDSEDRPYEDAPQDQYQERDPYQQQQDPRLEAPAFQEPLEEPQEIYN